MNSRRTTDRTRFVSLIAAFCCTAAAASVSAEDCQPAFVFSAATREGIAQQPMHGIESVSIEEPDDASGAGADKLVFRIKVTGFAQRADNFSLGLTFRFADDPAGLPRHVAMSMEGGRARFTFSGIHGEQKAEPESNYTLDGVITIVVRKEELRPDLAPGHQLIDITVAGSGEASAAGDAPQQYVTNASSYTLNGPCQLEPPPIRLANIAGRSLVRQGDDVAIGGFIISGPTAKRVIVRAIGPSLKSGDAALSGRMQNPTLEVRSGSGELIGQNDDWRTSPQAQQIQNSGLAPKEDREAAIIADLEAGSYTAILRGANATEGIAVIEIYDLQLGTQAELANLASRAFVSTGDNVLIGGFIVNGGGAARVLVRAIGSSLAGAVPDELEDPTIEVTNAEGAKVVENDNWRSSPNAAEIEATGAAPSDDREAAGTASVTAGPYTAVVRGARGSTGVGVVEIYRLGIQSEDAEETH